MLKVHFRVDLLLIADYGLPYTGRVRYASLALFRHFLSWAPIKGTVRFCLSSAVATN